MGRPILRKTLASLLSMKQSGETEILICGKIHDPETRAFVESMAARHPQVSWFPVVYAEGDSSEKKNLGWRKAAADLVAFVDDDVVVAEDWVGHVVSAFSNPEVGFVSGPSLVPEDVGFWARLAGLTLSSRAAGYVSERYLHGGLEPREVKWSRLIGCNMAFRKSLLEALGGFRSDFWPGEEMIAAWQACQSGHKLYFIPGAFLYHYPRESMGRFWKQIFGYGATRIRLIRAGVEVEPSSLVPGVWVLALSVALVLSFFSSYGVYLLGAILAAYAMVAAIITALKVKETGKLSDGLIFLTIPVMHLSYGIAQWVEFFRPGKDLSEASG